MFQQTDTIASIEAPFPMPRMARPVFPDRLSDIRSFGAVEGGTVKNTRSIQAAIDSTAAAGGGTVLIPEGTWLTGAIHLQSNINLHLAANSVLLFSQDVADYLPVVFSRHEDIECYKYSSFVYANGKSNIAITGKGTLNGQGKPWWSYKESKKEVERLLNEMAANDLPVSERIFDGRDGRELRPAFFQPMNCTSVLVEGVTFLYGAFWTITPTYCENVIVRNVHIVTEGPYGHTPNGDGVNPSSSRNVLIENCVFDTGDDCIAIKAGRDKDGLRVARPTENIVIRNCKGLSGHGGIVIGSETSGGVRNIYASNCSFTGTDRVVRIKTARGRGGVIENMWFEDLTGEDIQIEAIHINMLYTGSRLPEQPVTASTPSIRNIHFKRITIVSGKTFAVEFLGLPEMFVENVTIDGLHATAARGIHLSDVRGISIQNSDVTAARSPVLEITDGENIRFDGLTCAGSGNPLARIEGARSRNIAIHKSNIPSQGPALSIAPDVPAGSVVVE
jgi:polygalacturonase